MLNVFIDTLKIIPFHIFPQKREKMRGKQIDGMYLSSQHHIQCSAVTKRGRTCFTNEKLFLSSGTDKSSLCKYDQFGLENEKATL